MLLSNVGIQSTLPAGAYPAAEVTGAGKLSQSVTATRSDDEYITTWSEWVRDAPPGGGELREIAYARMRLCLDNRMDCLNLSQLNLSSLPLILPECIEILDVHCNQLRFLPETLPGDLRVLCVHSNQLLLLPDRLPENLAMLYVSNNQLTSLPENMPGSLLYIFAADNLLSDIPATLPDNLLLLELQNNHIVSLTHDLPVHLQELSLSNNQLDCLPDKLPGSLRNIKLHNNQLRRLPAVITNLSVQAIVHFEGNPLSVRTRRQLLAIADAVNYRGPVIHYSVPMCESGEELSDILLSESVTHWLTKPLSNDVAARWAVIDKEENAAAFSAFLWLLYETINARGNTDFKVKVANWLTRLAETPLLRERTFAVALDTTADCEDRVTLAWNAMQKVALMADVEDGDYDGKLPKLIEVAHEIFCLELLEQAAHSKVKARQLDDEVEVYLAYQTGLREALNLTTAAEEMRWAGVSGVTQQDLNCAQVEIGEKSVREFPGWLAQWDPWKTALLRLKPELVQVFKQRQEQRLNTCYQQQVNAVLETEELQGVPDAEACVSKTIWDKIQREIDISLTYTALRNYYLALMAETSPLGTLGAMTELAAIAAICPSLTAMVVQCENANTEHASSLLAGRIARGGMAALVGTWLTLLQLLYDSAQLSGQQIISTLLPVRQQESVRSLAHAIIGTAWYHIAATKLCALLSAVANGDQHLRQEIRVRMALKQSGFGITQSEQRQSMSLFKRIKMADERSKNNTALVWLREGQLIPKKQDKLRGGISARIYSHFF